MNLTPAQIQTAVSSFSLVKGCDVVRNGMVRLATPFQYPNGAGIDLFLGAQPELFDKWTLTDLGQTTAWLLDLNLKLWTTEKRKQLVTDICRGLKVLVEHGGNPKALGKGEVGHPEARLGEPDQGFWELFEVA